MIDSWMGANAGSAYAAWILIEETPEVILKRIIEWNVRVARLELIGGIKLHLRKLLSYVWCQSFVAVLNKHKGNTHEHYFVRQGSKILNSNTCSRGKSGSSTTLTTTKQRGSYPLLAQCVVAV
jgi:hypothetical protein